MSPTDDREGLNSIERELVDGDPALAEAFHRWQVPTAAPEERPGGTTAPPWVLAVFVTAAVSWVVSPGFGVVVGAVALAGILLDAIDGHLGRPGSRRIAHGRCEKEPDDADRSDDGGPPRTCGGAG